VTSGGKYFNDFPDNQLTKFRIFIGWSRIFRPSLNLYETSPFVLLRNIAKTDKWTETCLFVRLSVRSCVC